MPAHLITHINRYVPLGEAEAQLLLQYVKPLSVKKKTFLLKEGQICQENYFVEKGCLRLFFVKDEGNMEKTTQFAIENWWLTDLVSYDRQEPSQFFIQAVEDSELLCLPAEKQEELFAALPQLERYFRLVLQKAQAASQLRIKYIFGLSREQQYRHFSELFPEFMQRVPQYMLASYLGLTPEYLSELRKKKI